MPGYVQHGPCCFSGTLDTGTPRGSLVSLGGVQTYLARPSSPSDKAVVISTDLFGLNLQNVKLIADRFAAAGYLAAVPDQFRGGALPAWCMTLSMFAFFNVGLSPPQRLFELVLRPLLRFLTALAVAPLMIWGLVVQGKKKGKAGIFRAVIADLKADEGIRRIGMVGYSYGMPATLLLAQQDDVVDAFACAHGALELPGDIMSLRKPGFLAFAEKDPETSAEARKQVQALISKRKDVELRMKFYPGTHLGFAVRGDARRREIQDARQDCLERMLEMFGKHLA